jgi:hypothetical protein
MGSIVNIKTGRIVGEASHDRSLYILKANPIQTPHAFIVTLDHGPQPVSENEYALAARTQISSATLKTWHYRTCHADHDTLVRMAKKDIVRGMVLKDTKRSPDLCPPCHQGKQNRNDIPSATETRATEVLGRVFSDIKGPLMATQAGYQYIGTFKDNASRFLVVKLMKTKDEIFTHFKDYIAMVERQTGKQLRILRTDRGGEYT